MVTGGGRGFGRAIAEACAAAGASVVVTARTASELDVTVEAIQRAGGHALAVPADVTEPGDVETLRRETTAAFGPATIVVSAAGSLGPFGPLWEVDPESWWQVQTVHVRGAYLVMRAFAPDMIEAGRGRFIVLSSSASTRVRAFDSGYHLAKHGQNLLVSHLHEEASQHGVLAWAVHPGWVATGVANGVFESRGAQEFLPEVVEGFRARSSPDDVRRGLEQCARFCLELVSGRADALSGSYLVATESLEAQLRRARQGKVERGMRRAAGKARRLISHR